MKERNEEKISLVEFLRSIQFARQNRASKNVQAECPTHFANFRQSARVSGESSTEDAQLIRSAN